MPDPPAPVMVPLARPRRPTAAERALLRALVEHTGSEALLAQAGSVVVDSVCSCGCPSVGLRTDAPPLSTVDMLAIGGHGRDDVLGVHAYGDGIEVVVHVLNGRLAELEVYAGDGVVVDLPAPGDLTGTEAY